MAEVITGFLGIAVGAFAIYISAKKDFTANPFQTLLGVPEIRQRAYGLIAGIVFCLIGIIMIIQGLKIAF